ncbi:glycosyltransferase family 2 protein [Methanospirillum sp.]|uniref:glycosyltransferase family 2 protein n=1 Tax=Methanospirillum sp. TaxID=45200 RepID=UPI0035A11310
MKKKISVVIPAYNAELFINDSVNSVINQSYRPIEIIVVNDGSADSTPRITNELFEKISEPDVEKKLIFLEENKGAANALNIGFSCATGDYICWLSADDMFISNDKLSLQVVKMEKENACWSYYQDFLSGINIQKSTQIKPSYLPHLNLLDSIFLNNPYLRFMVLLYFNPINGSSIMIKKDCIMKYGQFDPILRNIDADGDLWMRYSVLGLKLTRVPGSPVFYREHEHQTSKNVYQMAYQTEVVRVRLLSILERSDLLASYLKKFFIFFAYIFFKKQYLHRPFTTIFLCEYILKNKSRFSFIMTRMSDKMLSNAYVELKKWDIDKEKIYQDMKIINESIEITNFVRLLRNE